MNDELKKLYDAIASRGFYTKSYDEFVNQYQDPAYRDKVFDVVTREGLYTKGRNEFDVKYSAAPLKKKESSVSTSQEVAMAQAAEDGSLASQESAPVLDFTKLRQQQQVQKYGELPAQPQAEPTMPPSPQLQQQVMNRMAAGEVDFVPAPLSQVYEKVRAGEQLDPIEQATLDQRKNKLEVERMVENYSNVKGVGAAANAGAQLFLEMLYPSAMPGSERASDYARNMNRAYKISIGIDPGDVDKSFSEQKDVQSAAKVFGVEAANMLGLSALSGMLMAPAATSFGVTATAPSLARQAAQTVSRNIAQNPASFALMGYAGSNSAYKQVKNDPTKSEAEKLAYSTYSGLKEMFTEAGFVGDLRAWNQTLSAAERSLAKQMFRSTVSDYLKTLGKQGLEEGTEEGISWAGDLLWALATGDKLPTAREGWEAMALGAVAPGFAVTGQYAPVMADFAAGYLPFTLPKSEDLTKLSELKKRQATIESDLKKEGLSQEERQKLEEMSDGLLNEIESLRASAWESRQNMSDEDFLTLAKIDAEVEGLYQQFEGAKTATMKMAIKQDVADLLEQKRKIENNYAIQEQATDEGVLRAEQPEVGLQEVGERDQESQVATAEGIEEVVQKEIGTVGTLLNERVVYDDPVSGQPVDGDLFVDGQRVVLEAAGGQQFDLGNVDEVLAQPIDGGIVRPAEMAIMPQEDGSFVFNKEDNQKVAKGTRMFNNQPGLQAITRDDAGNVKRVTLYSEDGTETYNLTGQEAEDAAYYIVRGFVETQEGQDAINQLAERNEEARRDLTQPLGVRPVQQAAPQAAVEVRVEAPAGPVVEGAAEVDAQELADLAADMRAATPARRERLERIAERARTAVSKILPDVKIIVHDTQEAYRAATTFEGEATYNNDTKTVHINGTKATPAAVAHEVFHAVFLDKVKTDEKAQAVAKKMVESLKRVLGEKSEAYQYLDEFSKDYAANFQDEEKLAEMVAVLSELYSGVNDIGLSPSAVQSVKNAIKKFITDLAKLFNIPMPTTLTDADVLAVLNTIAQKTVAGEVITESDVQTIDRVAAEEDIDGDAGIVSIRNRKEWSQEYENWASKPKSRAQILGHSYKMNHKGFVDNKINRQQFENDVRGISDRLGVAETKSKSGYYMTLDGKFFNPYKKVIEEKGGDSNDLRQRMGQPNENIFDIVTMARQKGYTDKTIEIYLKQEGFAAEDIKDAMAVNSNIDGAQVPQEFGNVTGGMAQGQTLFDEIKAKLTKMAADGASMMDIRIEAQTLLMDSDVYKAQNAEVKAQLRLSLDATIGTKAADRAFRQEFKQLRAMLADRKKARRELETIKRMMRGFIRKNLPQGEYSKAEVVALLKAIVDANVDTLPLVMEKVEGYVTGLKVRKLEKQIQKLLDTKTTGMVSGRQVGRVSVELQNQLAELNDKESPVLADDSMSEEAVDRLMSNQLATYNRIMAQTYITEQEAAEAQLLSIAMMYNDAYMMEDTNPNKVETLQSVVENLAAMIATGRAEMRAELDQQRAQYKAMVADAYSEITGEQLDMSDTEDAKAANEKKIREAKNLEEKKKNFRNRIKGAIGKMSSFVDNYFTRQMDLPLLLSRITSVITESFGGKLQETVDGRLFDARTEFTRRKMEVMKMLEQKQKEIFGKDYKNQMAMNVVPRFSNDIVNDNEAIFVDMIEAEKLRKEYKSANDKRRKAIVARLTDLEIELSPNQDYYLYNQYKDPANRASFSKKFVNEGDYIKAMEIITNRLDPKVKEWADWQVNELFPSLYEAYNEVYKSIYRTNMPWNQFYAGRIYREGQEGDNTFDLLQGSNEYRTSVGGQSTKARIKNQRPIENMDGNSALNSYLEDMEYFRAYAEVMRDMNKLFENPNIEDAINKTAGSNTHRALKDMMGRIATRGVKGSESQVVNGMINNFIVSKLGFNPTIMVKQLTSAIAFSDYIGWGNWSLYMAKAMPDAKSLWKEWYDNSPVLQERYENSNMSEVLEGYNRTAVAKTSPVLLNKKLFGKDVTILDSDVARWQNSLMYLIKVGDKGGVMGGLANYLYYKDEFKAKNPNATEQQAIDYASRKATRQAVSTQQDSGITNKDWYQTAGPVFRFLNVFMSSPKALFRKEMYAVMQLYRKISAKSTKAGAGSLTDNLRTLITYHVGVPMLFQWVALGLPGVLANWDEEDEESLGRAAILGNLNALFIVGDLILGIKDFLEDNPWAGEFKTLPIFEQASEIIQDLKAYSKAKKEETREKHLVKLINHTVELTGIPASSMYRMYNNLSELSNSDTGEAILRLLNFSEYVVEEKASEDK